MRRNFFSRLLAVNRRLFEELRTPAGRPLGDFYLLAEQLTTRGVTTKSRSGKLETDGNSGCPSGIATFASDTHVARSNYHWAFVLGLPEHHEPHRRHGILSRLRMPKIRMGLSRGCAVGELRRSIFKRDHSRNLSPDLYCARRTLAAPALLSPLDISENKAFCSDNELIDTRMEMKPEPTVATRYSSVLHERLTGEIFDIRTATASTLYLLMRPLVRTMRVHITVLSVAVQAASGCRT